MKKAIQYGLLVVLVIAAIYLITSKSKSTIKRELRDFAVEDTSTVDKVFLVDKANHSILLERKSEYWQLNGKYEARADLVNLLLRTAHRMRIKEPVSKAAQESVFKGLAVKSTKVEIYQKGKLSKVFYVGGPTQDSHGTYMIMENSTTPFVVEITELRGYLSSRFSTNESEWKTQRVFNYDYNDVAEVIFENHVNEGESFCLKKEGADFIVFNYPEMDRQVLTDTINAKRYFSSLKNKNFSKYVDDIPLEWKDSIIASQPMYTFTIIDTKSTEKWYRLYNKPGWGKLDAFGEELVNDPDHFFMLMDNNDFVYGQYYVFGALFKDLKDFTN